jgi:6-phosphogluconolactonase
MHFTTIRRRLRLTLPALFMGAAAFATTPVVTIASPGNDSQITSPVNYVASARSPECSKGISTMQIYSAPGVIATEVSGGKMNSYINLPRGTYNTVVQAWDNCGGVGKANVKLTITGEAQPAGFVYTVNTDYWSGNTANFVRGFTIVPGKGALALTWQGPVKANVAPSSVASDKGGYRLYVGDRVSGDVFAYYINRSNGYLTPVPGSPFPVNRSVTAVAVHPSGKFVFVTRDEQSAGDGVEVFELQSDGSLKPAPGSPYATENGPQALVVDPTGKYLYVADQSDYINAFEINTTSGMLTPLAGSPFKTRVPSNCRAGSDNPLDIIDFAGKYLYTADDFIDSISGFTIGVSGAPAEMAGSPYPDNGGCNVPVQCTSCSQNPSSLAIDGTGKFLYGVNTAPDVYDISIYSIGANGALTHIKDAAQMLTCYAPIRGDATGNYLYAESCNAPGGYIGLVGFSINHTTGDLTELPSSPYTYPNQSTKAPVLQNFTVTP